MNNQRISWVDYGKGICIILVVMMHTTLGYSEMVHAEGWMTPVVAWAKPFRMPDFFLLAGLFLNLSIFGLKKSYFDRKVLHFAYFYLLWLGIQTALFEANLLLSDPIEFATIFLSALVFPKSSLWFIHMLAIFYVITWTVRHVSTMKVLAAAAILQIAFSTGFIDTGWSVTNRIMEWFVYFFAGYSLSGVAFSWAQRAAEDKTMTLGLLLGWIIANTCFVAVNIATLPIVSLALGMAGAFAIIAIASVLADLERAKWLSYVGANSIVVYLTFFIPMKILQKVFASTGLVESPGTVSILILIISVASPLAIHWMIKGTPLNWLYVRPEFLKMGVDRNKPAKAHETNIRATNP